MRSTASVCTSSRCIGALAALGAVVALVAAGSARSGEAGAGRHTCVPRAAEITFRAADKTRLAGYRLGRGTTAVVLGHQVRGTACQWAAYAKRLARLGYLVVAFDFRGDGESQERFGKAAGRLAADVAAAAKLARARGARKVFALGASMGGTAVLAAGATTKPPLTGVISTSGPATFGWISAVDLVPRLTVPVLYLVGEHDAGGGFAEDARRLYAATASSDKTLEILPVSEHGVSLVQSNARARELVEGFLRSH